MLLYFFHLIILPSGWRDSYNKLKKYSGQLFFRMKLIFQLSTQTGGQKRNMKSLSEVHGPVGYV